MKKDETALGEHRDQSSGRKMEEDVGDCVPTTDIRDGGLERDTFIG